MKITIEGTPEECAEAIRKLADRDANPDMQLAPAVAKMCVHGLSLDVPCSSCVGTVRVVPFFSTDITRWTPESLGGTSTMTIDHTRVPNANCTWSVFREGSS